MDESEFLESLKTEEDRFNEFTAGAEHFVRLKRQAGQPSRNDDLEKTAFLGFGKPKTAPKAEPEPRPFQISIDASPHIAWYEELNKPENVDRVNNLMENYARKNYPHADKVSPLKGLHESEWDLAWSHAMTDPHFRALHDKHFAPGMQEKTAGLGDPGLPGVLGTLGMGIGAIHGAATSPGERGKGALRGAGDGSLFGLSAGLLAEAAKAIVKRKHASALSQTLAEKRAGVADKLKSLGPLTLALMGTGAAVGGAGAYLASKPQEELGGRSRAEDELEAKVQSQQGRPEGGLLRKMKNRTAELEHGYAKAFRDHPGKASLLVAGAGAASGYGLARLLGAVRGASK